VERVDALNGALGQNRCIVCGLANPEGMRACFRVEGETVVCEHTFDDRWIGYPGLVHGGATSAIMDDLLVWTLAGLRKKLSFTVDLHLRFRAPVHVGRKLRMVGKLTGDRRGIFSVDGSMADVASGETLTEASARLIVVSREKFIEITGVPEIAPEWLAYF